LFHHRDSFLCLLDFKNIDGKDDDDETASTVSCSESCSSGSSSVTFAEPLVSDVFFRPATSREEKHLLYYCDRDFREFRKEYQSCGKREPRDSVVSFSETIVTGVHLYPPVEDKSALYYSESDLKRYAHTRHRVATTDAKPRQSDLPQTVPLTPWLLHSDRFLHEFVESLDEP
jgi:hypothetical protein